MDTAATRSNGEQVLSLLVFSIRLIRLLFARVNNVDDFVYVKYHFVADHGQKQFTAWLRSGLRISSACSPQIKLDNKIRLDKLY